MNAQNVTLTGSRYANRILPTSTSARHLQFHVSHTRAYHITRYETTDYIMSNDILASLTLEALIRIYALSKLIDFVSLLVFVHFNVHFVYDKQK